MKSFDEVKDRLIKLEMQLLRYSSDLESEKATRARINSDLEQRLRSLEKSNWKANGFYAAVIIIFQYLITYFSK